MDDSLANEARTCRGAFCSSWCYTYQKKKMKLHIYLITVAFVFTTFKTVESKMTMDQIKSSLKPFKNSCLKKVTVDTDLVEGTKNGNFPPEKPLMCFTRCILQMLKVMKNGEISLTAIMQQIDIMMPDEYVETMKQTCTKCAEIARQYQDPCEMAFYFIKCFYETDSEMYFFP